MRSREQRRADKADRRLARYTAKELRVYERGTGRKKLHAPRPFRIVMLLYAVLSMVIGFYIAGWMVVSGLIVSIWYFGGLLTFFIFLPVVVLVREQASNSVYKTTQVKVHDLHVITSDGHVPGQHKVAMSYEGMNPNPGPGEEAEIDDTVVIEAIWGGSLKNWPGDGRGPLILAINQFFPGEDGVPTQAGFLEGDTYHIPAIPVPMRASVFKEARDSRLWDQLKNLPVIGDRLCGSTQIIMAFEPVSLPEAIPQGKSPVNDRELWHKERQYNKLLTDLQQAGVSDRLLKKLGVRKE